MGEHLTDRGCGTLKVTADAGGQVHEQLDRSDAHHAPCSALAPLAPPANQFSTSAGSGGEFDPAAGQLPEPMVGLRRPPEMDAIWMTF